MNKKGFTTIELILTIVVVLIIMATITSVTYTYRDRSVHEEDITSVKNYKNMVTKIIYDDIIDPAKHITRIQKEDDYHYKFIGEDLEYSLEIIEELEKVGIRYNGIEYLVPDSKLITIDSISYQEDAEILYQLDIVFEHQNLEDPFKIHLVVSQ